MAADHNAQAESKGKPRRRARWLVLTLGLVLLLLVYPAIHIYGVFLSQELRHYAAADFYSGVGGFVALVGVVLIVLGVRGRARVDQR